jgi:hypothetical protein
MILSCNNLACKNCVFREIEDVVSTAFCACINVEDAGLGAEFLRGE